MAEVSVDAEGPEPLVAVLMWGIGHSVSVVVNWWFLTALTVLILSRSGSCALVQSHSTACV